MEREGSKDRAIGREPELRGELRLPLLFVTLMRLHTCFLNVIFDHVSLAGSDLY